MLVLPFQGVSSLTEFQAASGRPFFVPVWDGAPVRIPFVILRLVLGTPAADRVERLGCRTKSGKDDQAWLQPPPRARNTATAALAAPARAWASWSEAVSRLRSTSRTSIRLTTPSS